MGIKDVFNRIKGKSDDKDKGAQPDALSRRDTNEETVQVNAAPSNRAPSDGSQESATVVAQPPPRPAPRAPAAAPSASDEQQDATVVAEASPPPVLKNAGPTPRAPVAPPAPVPPSVTPVAPSADRIPIPPTIAPAPRANQPAAPRAASPAPSSSASVSSADDTLYQKPDGDNALDVAAVLVGIYGETKDAIFRVPFGTSTIGRADECGVQLLDAKVSREHASIRCAADGIEITPLNDRNPVLINDEAISGPHVVVDGDKIQFGNAGASILRLRTIAGL